MLAQAQEPGVDFSNEYLYPKNAYDDNSDEVWTFAIWQLKLLRAYDFVGRDNFTEDERAILDKWFMDGAKWQAYLANEKALNRSYVQRGIPIENYILSWNDQITTADYQAYRNGPYPWRAGLWHNNRRWGQISFAAHVGVMLNDLSLKQTGSWAFKEWLAFHFYKDGYPIELHRSYADLPEKGLGYVASSTSNAAMVAKVLYLDGYENLFDYTTDICLDQNTGALAKGKTIKSLEWAILQIRSKFMDSDSPDLYPRGTTGTSFDLLMHYSKSTVNSGQWKHRVKPGEPSSIANWYYNNPQIKDMHWPGGGLSNYPPKPSSQGIFQAWTGTDGQFPGYLFMYAQ